MAGVSLKAFARTGDEIFLAVAATFLLGIPLLFLIDGSSSLALDVTTRIAVVSTLSLCTWGLVSSLSGGGVKLLGAIFWLFMYVTAAVVPLAQMQTGIFPNLIEPAYLLPAQVLMFVAGLAFLVGHSCRWKNDGPSQVRGAPVNIWVLRAGAAAALAFAAYYVLRVGGPTTFFETREALGEVVDDSTREVNPSQVQSALLTGFGTVPILISGVLWLQGLLRGVIKKATGNLILAGLLLMGNLVVNSPLVNARYWVLACLSAILFGLPRFGRRSLRVSVLLGVVGALVIFPYSDVTRSNDGTGSLQYVPLAEMLSTKDYDQWVMTANGFGMVHQSGHTGGLQLTGSVLFFVPRSNWPGKPADTGTEIGLSMGVQNVNLSSPLPLELWVDGGWLGASLGMLAFGMLAGRLDRRFSMGRSARRDWLEIQDSLIPLIAGYSLILFRGPLLQAMSKLSIMLAFHAALSYASGRATVSSRPVVTDVERG